MGVVSKRILILGKRNRSDGFRRLEWYTKFLIIGYIGYKRIIYYI